MIIGGLPLWGISSVAESQQLQNIVPSDWIALGYATVFGSAIAYGLFFHFASSGNLTSLSSLTFLTPVFALVFGHLLLQEVLNPVQWVGVSLTLVSIYLINQRENLSGESKKLAIADKTLTQQQQVLEASAKKMNQLTLPVRESEPEMLP